MLTERPTGTVTFLFTDIEGSTRLWEEHPHTMGRAVARHDEILRTAIEQGSGYIFSTAGDAYSAAFADPLEAALAAQNAQVELDAEEWDDTGPIRVRMAMHSGIAEERDGDYFGPPLNRAARILAAAEGGVILTSETTAGLLRHLLPDEVELTDLGERRLKDLPGREHVYRLDFGGLGPPPRRRRPVILGAGLVVVIALAGLGIVLSRPQPAAETTDSTVPSVEPTDSVVGADPELIWQVPLTEGALTGPTVTTGLVLVGTSQRGDGTLHGLDHEEGTEAWNYPAVSAINAAAVAQGGTAFFSAGQRVIAVDAGAGSESWRDSLPFTDASPPAVHGERVFVGGENIVYAYDAHPPTRSPAREWVNDNFVLTTISVRPAAAGNSVFVADTRQLYALDAETGAPQWRETVGAGILEYDSLVVSIVATEVEMSLGGDRPPERQIWVFVNDQDGSLSVWNGATSEPIWPPPTVRAVTPPAIARRTVFAVDEAGELLFISLAVEPTIEASVPVGRTSFAPVVDGNLVYVVTDEGTLQVVDTATRQVSWSWNLAAAPAGSPAAAGGVVYVSDIEGTVTALQPDV